MNIYILLLLPLAQENAVDLHIVDSVPYQSRRRSLVKHIRRSRQECRSFCHWMNSCTMVTNFYVSFVKSLKSNMFTVLNT